MIIDGDFYFCKSIPKYEYVDDGSYQYAVASCYLMCGNKEIFSTALYYNTNLHSFSFDMQGIISAYMNSHDMTVAEFSIELEDAAGFTLDSVTFSAIYYNGCYLKDPYEFLRTHFLNDLDSGLVPQHFKAVVNFYCADYDEKLNVYAVTANSFKTTLLKSIDCEPGMISHEIDISSIFDDAFAEGIIDADFRIARLIVIAGKRYMTFHIVDKRPAFAIAFRNGFNLVEHFWSFGSWKRSSSVKGESAMVDGKLLTYGVTQEDSFELSTHRMNAQQLMHGLNFLSFTPADITLFLGRQAFTFHGVISEVKCDNDPFSGELSQVRITATANSNLGVLTFNSDEAYNIFTNPFDISFQ